MFDKISDKVTSSVVAAPLDKSNHLYSAAINVPLEKKSIVKIF